MFAVKRRLQDHGRNGRIAFSRKQGGEEKEEMEEMDEERRMEEEEEDMVGKEAMGPGHKGDKRQGQGREARPRHKAP